jgi:polyisoprenoid-binding protein YceI
MFAMENPILLLLAAVRISFFLTDAACEGILITFWHNLFLKPNMFKWGLILIAFVVQANAQVYSSSTGKISFFSEGTVSNVDANNEKVKVELNLSTGEMTFAMNMKDFQFENHKMQKDAAESKYLETDKYRDASFKGKINNKIDYSINKVYPITVSGKLKIHGVQRDVIEKGTLTIKKGQIILQSEFNILFRDYNIETPKITFKEMTEDNADVKINVILPERKKN